MREARRSDATPVRSGRRPPCSQHRENSGHSGWSRRTAVLRERAEHLVGRDVDEAESVAAGAVQPRPVAQRRLQQNEGAAHVGFDERSRIVDRAVDMAFRREMEDGIRVEIAKSAVHGAFVRDVGVHELVARRTHDLGDGFAPTGIGQLIDREDLVAVAHSPAHRAEPMNPAPPVTISLIHTPSDDAAGPRD